MTLKTTKEQREALLIKLDDPDFNVYNTITVYNSVLRDLCHDADEARKMETEMMRLDAGWTEAIEVCNAFYSQVRIVCLLEKENAELRGRIKHYERAEPEAGKALRQENADLRAQLEEEAKEHEAKLKEQQAASNNLNERLGNCKQSAKEGWRYAYELEQERKKLNEENADLRAKLNGAQKDAERYRIIRYMGPMPFWMDYGGSVHDADGCDRAADKALKEQEK